MDRQDDTMIRHTLTASPLQCNKVILHHRTTILPRPPHTTNENHYRFHSIRTSSTLEFLIPIYLLYLPKTND